MADNIVEFIASLLYTDNQYNWEILITVALSLDLGAALGLL